MWLCLLIVLVIAGGALYGIISIIISGVESVIVKAPEYSVRANVLVQDFNEFMRSTTKQIYGRSSTIKFEQFLDMKALTTLATQWLGGVFSLLGDFILVLLYLVFMVTGGDNFSKKLSAAFASNNSKFDVLRVYHNVHSKVLNYLGLKTLLNILNGFITWVTLLAFGVDFAALMGVLSFLFHYLPNIGSFLAVVLPGVVTLLQTGDIGFTLIVVLVLVVLNNLSGNILEPKVMGDSLDLSPVVVLFALIFWGWMWGVVGMILSVPIMAVLKTIMENFSMTRPLAILMGSKVPKVIE